MKGIIALDIDGTITPERHEVPEEVVEYLTHLSRKGWLIIFITGRTFLWGYETLKALPFHYFLAVQNGAIILDMPSRTIVSRKYIGAEVLTPMNEICKGEPSDFVLYAGYEHGDRCFYRPEHFAPHLLEYLRERVDKLHENWIAVKQWNEIDIKEFASLKCFGDYPSACRVANKIEANLGLHIPIIRDPFNENSYVAQATHPKVSKGFAVEDFKSISGCQGPVIAAGDDNNDRTMLAAAHIKIVMETAPKDMLEMADIVAAPAAKNGIIEGLCNALQILE